MKELIVCVQTVIWIISALSPPAANEQQNFVRRYLMSSRCSSVVCEAAVFDVNNSHKQNLMFFQRLMHT